MDIFIDWLLQHRRNVLLGTGATFLLLFLAFSFSGGKQERPQVKTAAQEVPKWMQESLPGYSQYASATLLIAKGELEQALEGSKKLKASLMQQKQAHGLLFAYNLLRIATLEREVGTPQGELLAWQEVKALEVTSYLSLLESFREKNVGLADYIKHREGLLPVGAVDFHR